MVFICNFTGRLKGGKGKFLTFTKIRVDVTSEADVKAALKVNYSDITKLSIKPRNP